MEISELSMEMVKILASLAAPFAMFGTVVLILRWFKTDTTDLMKIYSDSTKAQIEAIHESVKAIQTDVKAIQADVRDFHNRLCAVEEKARGK